MNTAYLPVLLLVCGLLLLGVILGIRLLDALVWRRALVAFQLHPPVSLAGDEVAAWLSGVQAMTHPTRYALMPLPPVCIEVSSTARGISYFLVVPKQSAPKMLSGIRASMPGCRISEAQDYLHTRPAWQAAAELTMTNRTRPLAAERAEQASAALIAALQPVTGTAEIRIQVIVTSAGTPRPVPTASATRDASPAWMWDSAVPHDAEAVHAMRAKIREPLLVGVVRVGVSAATKAQAYQLFGRVWNNYHLMNAVGVRLRCRFLPSALVADRLRIRAYPLTRWPLLVSSQECVGLLALPIGGLRLPGLSLGAARQLPPSPAMAHGTAIVGVSNYPGMTTQPLSLRTIDRLRHTHLIGPTGVGKSTVIARLALHDIVEGRSVIVIDPKGDVIEDILARFPEHRREDLVVLDPAAASGSIVGFNPLNAAGGSEHARELVADHLLNIFHSLYRDFWGPRTDDILRAALLTVTHTKAPDGSAFTLIEVPELLTNPALRRYVSAQASLPPHLRLYWQHFDSLSEDARAHATSPVLNKLRAFTMRTPVRLMLGQSTGIRLDYRFCRRGVLLVPLAKGTLGGETANLLGSLIVAALWQAMLGRIRLPSDRRPATFAFLDEFQDIIRFGAATDLADMLAQARGLGLGLVLSHQYLHQLPDTMQHAVLGTVRTQIAFQSEYADAQVLAQRFAPLTADDLQGLSAYEIAARLCVGGSTQAPVTGTTLPLDAPTRDGHELARLSRERYGQPRTDIEAAIQARSTVTPSSATVGRRHRGSPA